MAADTSPVNAPSRSQYRSCAETPMLLPCAASAAALSAVNGGPTTISTPDISLTLPRRSDTKATVSPTVLNIFQLPAMNGVRMLLVRKCRDARQRAAPEEFERRAPAG